MTKGSISSPNATAVALVGIHVCAQEGKEPEQAQDVHENQLQRSNRYLTHLKTSLGRTGLGRLLGGGGLTALSSLTSFASFAGLG